MDSNASYAAEVERNVSETMIFSLRQVQLSAPALGQLPVPGTPLGFIQPLSR